VAFTDDNGVFNTGYYIHPTDSLTLYNELMNMDDFEKEVYLTVNYEYLEGLQEGWNYTKAVWVSIGPSCSDPKGNGYGSASSPVNAKGEPKAADAFAVPSTNWTAPWAASMIGTDGHLHDGGTSVELFRDNAQLCTSTAAYGQSPAYIEHMTAMPGMPDTMTHISSMSGCKMMGNVATGDTLNIVANYDFKEHQGMLDNKGSLGEIMGIAVVYLTLPQDV